MSIKASKLTKTPLKTDLLHFYDDFSELNDYCAFMCDALARVSLKESYLDDSSAISASRFCNCMKQRMQEMKKDSKKIHKKANVQNQDFDESESN